MFLTNRGQLDVEGCTSPRLCCDNLGAIKISRRRLMRIRPGMSCADILKNIRSARNKMTTNLNYHHVFGHMDDFLQDHQLTLEQKMNKRCDFLAKDVVDNWLRVRGTDFGNQLLPGECCCFGHGQKGNGRHS